MGHGIRAAQSQHACSAVIAGVDTGSRGHGGQRLRGAIQTIGDRDGQRDQVRAVRI